MTTKHNVPLLSPGEQHAFMPNKAMASARKDQLQNFGEQIFMVDEAQASMSMLCSALSSPQLLNKTTTTTTQLQLQRMVKLKSSDEKDFEVGEAVANESELVKDIIQVQGTCCPIVLNVSSQVLYQVIEYCEFLVENRNADPKGQTVTAVAAKWDADFVKKCDEETLFGLVLAAKELRIPSLLDLVCQRVADMIAGKPVREIRKIFHIENDFTTEEEAKIRKENKWAFDMEDD